MCCDFVCNLQSLDTHAKVRYNHYLRVVKKTTITLIQLQSRIDFYCKNTIKMERIIHLDLKGAPLKIRYLEKVLLCAKSWGATGILLEWEDTFPYSGELVDIGSQTNSGGDEMYSLEEVQHILKFAKDNGLEAIQLVQTIGHMEFVLKHPEFQGLREAARSPAVLCPSRPESQVLVQAMLQQVLDAQSDAKYLHIGADEVWHIAVCNDCKQRALNSKHKEASLFLEHVRDTVLFVKQKRPELTVLMWDDMLRSISVDTLKAYEFGDLVQPVLWDYNVMEHFNINHNLWENYERLFSCVWAGSAFKGANGSCKVLSPVARYVSNHEAWMQEIENHSNHIKFAGIILTGWSRYDHYATLCELLPVSMPSLASCLRILTKSDEIPKEMLVNEVLPPEEWPGEQLSRCVHSFVILKDRCSAFLSSDMIMTWLNPWQIEHRYTNSAHVENILYGAQSLRSELFTLQRDISTHLHAITGERSKQEWMQTYIEPVMKQLTDIYEVAESRARCDASVRP